MIFISEWSSEQVLGILTLLLIKISVSSSYIKVRFCSNPSLPLPVLLLVLLSLSQKPLCPCIFFPSYLLTCIQRHNLAVVLRVQDHREKEGHTHHTHTYLPHFSSTAETECLYGTPLIQGSLLWPYCFPHFPSELGMPLSLLHLLMNLLKNTKSFSICLFLLLNLRIPQRVLQFLFLL